MKVVGIDAFLYLDIKMSYDSDDSLYFSAYSKPKYQSKYLNVRSCYIRTCVKVIP